MQTATVKIANPDNKRTGYKIINADAFDPKKHTLFEAKAGKAPAPPVPKTEVTVSADAIKAVIDMAGDNNVPFPTFRNKAVELLGDKTPAKKAEIVAALEDLAKSIG